MVADAFSRMNAIEFPQVLDYEMIRVHQMNGPELQAILKDPTSTSLNLQLHIFSDTSSAVYCGV